MNLTAPSPGASDAPDLDDLDPDLTTNCFAAHSKFHAGSDPASSQAASTGPSARACPPGIRKALQASSPPAHAVHYSVPTGPLISSKLHRKLQALGDSSIPDEPSYAEDWETAIEGLRLAREASNQASIAAQLIGKVLSQCSSFWRSSCTWLCRDC